MDLVERREEGRSEFSCDNLAPHYKEILAQRHGRRGRGASTGDRITVRGAF
jgi:hypothetical protein